MAVLNDATVSVMASTGMPLSAASTLRIMSPTTLVGSSGNTTAQPPEQPVVQAPRESWTTG